jgi:hypothetical protein
MDARLALLRGQPETRANVARALKTRQTVGSGAEGERSDWTDTRNPHEASAKLVLSDDLDDHVVQFDILLPYRRARGQHAIEQLGGHRIVGGRFARGLVEAPPADLAQFHAEVRSECRIAFWRSRDLRFIFLRWDQQQPQPVRAVGLAGTSRRALGWPCPARWRRPCCCVCRHRESRATATQSKAIDRRAPTRRCSQAS